MSSQRRSGYYVEYLGSLLYGHYHWVKGGPDGYARADFDALLTAGLLTKIETWQSPKAEFEMRGTYEVSSE